MDNTFNTSWQQFRETGLFLFVNHFLHIFGWCIVLEVDDDSGEVLKSYPQRCEYSGFSEESTERAFKRVREFLKNEHGNK